MTLRIGKLAPDFTLKGTSGISLELSKDYSNKPFILFFYPKDFTRGCTAEVCEFRDQFAAFRELDIAVFGISRDDIPTHEEFKKRNRLPFELLSDPNGEVCQAYDALVPFLKMPKRITYLINKNRKVAAVYSGILDSKSHIKAMLDQIDKKDI